MARPSAGSTPVDYRPADTAHTQTLLQRRHHHQVLPSVVSVHFKSLRCIHLEGLEVRYLHADTSIDCATREYAKFASDIKWFLALYLSIPLVYFALLSRVSDRLHAPTSRSGSEHEMGAKETQTSMVEEAALRLQEASDPELRPLKFLYKGYRSQFW